MTPKILGLHHVTATVDDAQDDLDFCIDLLGLRLVKKTVNFDNHNVYHFYYGTEAGAPGTIWTTFPYAGYGVRDGVKGAGQVVTTAFSVPTGSLEFWRNRLRHAGVAFNDTEAHFGEPAIGFNDPSGLLFELIASDRDARAPWVDGGISASAAIRGLHNVTMLVKSAGSTIHFMTASLAYRIIEKQGKRTRLAAGGDTPGHYIDVLEDFSAHPAINGVGTVHHVAMAIGSAEEQLAVRDQLLAEGVGVTDVRDRTYFTSIYFQDRKSVV